jgi:hypothetical protein
MSVLGWRLRTVATAAAACALVVAVAACGDDGEAADDGPTTSTSETTIASTTTTQDPEAEVEAAYLAYWEMNKRLSEAPDPDDPELGERATGTALDKLVESLTTMRAAGERFVFGPEYSHLVESVEVSDDNATIRDCAIDDAIVENNRTGAREELGVSTALLEASLVFTDHGWLVSTISRLSVWEGAVRCEA